MTRQPPRAFAGEELPARRMKIDVELKAEHRVARHDRRPARLCMLGAQVLLAQHRQCFEPQPFADVRLGRQAVGRAEFVSQVQPAESRLDMWFISVPDEKVWMCPLGDMLLAEVLSAEQGEWMFDVYIAQFADFS